MSALHDALQVGALQAPNRIVMAPMTRARGTRDHLPTAVMVDYYRQRAGAGLIISEGIGISQQGLGWPYATGIWSNEQVAGWRAVTDAVHAAGGRIVAQLWHMGRTVHPSFLGGAAPVSASATRAPGHAHTYDGRQPYAAARPLTLDEIEGVVGDFRCGARNALRAGFDGVELHAANGYLIDQFMSDNSNVRSDAYGGSIAHRLRLLLDVTAALIEEVGAERVGVRLSPNGTVQGVRDSQPELLFTTATQELSRLGIAFLELREPPLDGTFGVGDVPPMAPQLRPHFSGVLLVNSDYSAERARDVLASRVADAVTFGRLFISNPDLVERLRRGIPLSADEPTLWFTQGAEGYVDYPASEG